MGANYNTYWHITISKDFVAGVYESTDYHHEDDDDLEMYDRNRYNAYFYRVSGNYFLSRDEAIQAANTINSVFKKQPNHPQHINMLKAVGRIPYNMFSS